MKKFEITSSMLTMDGTFYPRGYVFIMFPSAEEAEHVGQEIANAPFADTAMFLDSTSVLRDVGKVEGDSDLGLPSVGTEGATVRKYIDLARQGQCAVMVKVDSDDDAELVMKAARTSNFSYGQRYHLLAIEDLE